MGLEARLLKKNSAMIVWDTFIWFAAPAVLLSIMSAVMAFFPNGRKLSIAFSVFSIMVLGGFIVGFWAALGRPPLRTMGETRLWYSLFALSAGLFTYLKWKYKWILSYSTVLSTVFILLNILKPEIHDHTLMPALQSPWFIPHVTVYMFSYSLLGCAFLLACVGLFRDKVDILTAIDTLVYIGTAFLTFGMLSGSLWAKDAWGHYWNWDPKETWAAITWLTYMIYIHLRIFRQGKTKSLCLLIIFAFVCLQMCWWGINYLPSAQDSIHIYNR